MLIKTSISFSSLLIAYSSWAVNPHDEYYADDIFTAIEEAKKRPHHYDYSNAKRYNRTTTQSLDIPRLLNQEMEVTSIKSEDKSPVSAADTPVADQEFEDYKEYNASAVNNSNTTVRTVSPVLNNPNVIAPNLSISVQAR